MSSVRGCLSRYGAIGAAGLVGVQASASMYCRAELALVCRLLRLLAGTSLRSGSFQRSLPGTETGIRQWRRGRWSRSLVVGQSIPRSDGRLVQAAGRSGPLAHDKSALDCAAHCCVKHGDGGEVASTVRDMARLDDCRIHRVSACELRISFGCAVCTVGTCLSITEMRPLLSKPIAREAVTELRDVAEQMRAGRQLVNPRLPFIIVNHHDRRSRSFHNPSIISPRN